jgi:Protein of unknown function (DUF3551)
MISDISVIIFTERSMRRLAALAIAAAGFGVLYLAPAQAQEYPWCAQYGNGNGGRNCGFATHRQCMAAISGNGGSSFCERNPFFRGRWRAAAPRDRYR